MAGRRVAISPAQLEAFRKTTIPDERLFLLPHAWEITEPAPVDEAQGMDYYLFLGRLTEAKGVRTLLDAWRQLGVGAPKLVIAGEGELGDEVRAVAEREIVLYRQVLGPLKGRLTFFSKEEEIKYYLFAD